MPLLVKVKGKNGNGTETLFVEQYKAKVKVTDVSGNRSDKFNPNVSTGPKMSS